MRRGIWFCAGTGLVLAGAVIAGKDWQHTSAGQFDPVGAVFALAGLVTGLAGLWQGSRSQLQADLDTSAVSARLAVAVQKAETAALSRLLGGHDRTINVRFAFRRAPAHQATGASAGGTLTELADYYRALRPQRLVITGAGGSGKTVMAAQLILRLIEERAPDDPVPVRMSAALLDTGRPVGTAVTDWLVSYLRQTYQLPAAAAGHLVAARMVLPILDGLDEMDAGSSPGYASRAGQAVRACNAYLAGVRKGRLVLTCRTGQYEALEASREWVRDAARVEISPVDLASAEEFLTGRATDEERWRPVLTAMREGASANRPLAAALSTPWRLTLAATVYEQRNRDGDFLRDPAELTGPDLDTEDKIRDDLLRLFIPAVVAARAEGPPAAQVHRWLAVLARYLDRNVPAAGRPGRSLGGRDLSGSDLVPHELWALAGSRLPRALPIAVFLLVWASLETRSLMPFGAHSLLILIVDGSTLVAFLAAYLGWVRIWPDPVNFGLRQVRSFTGMRRLLAFLLAGLVFQLMIFLADVLASGLANAVSGQPFGVLAYALTAVLVSALAVAFAVVLLRMRYTLINHRGDLKSAIVVNLVFGLTFGFAGSLGDDAVFGLAGAIAYGLLGGLQRVEYSPTGPEEGLKSAIGTNIAIVLIIGIMFGVGIASAFGIGYIVRIELGYALSAGLAFSLALQPQGWRYLALLVCTRRWTQRWLPWRLGNFLKWSYDVGLLRIAGFGYQFRHRELQDYLAGHPSERRDVPRPRGPGAHRRDHAGPADHTEDLLGRSDRGPEPESTERI